MKRFTETKKWSDPWFRKLDPKFKALWLYLVDSCDVAGVWDADLELAEIHIRATFDMEEVRQIFEGKIDFLSSGKWFIKKFIYHQYGVLNPENNCHKAVLKSLQAHHIEVPIEGLNSPLFGAQGKGKDKVKKEGECEGKLTLIPENLDTLEFRELWKRWERHRQQIKHPLKPEMEVASLKKLSTLGLPRAIEVIEYTLEKGWQGLSYEEHKNGNGNPFAKPIQKSAI